VSLVWTHARAETLQLLRYPSYSVPTLALPAVFLLAFGRGLATTEPERLLAGFAATAVLMVTFFQFGVGISVTRATPWETFARTLPVGAGTRLAARVLSALAFAAATVTVVGAVAISFEHARPSPANAAGLLAGLLLGAVPFALLGIALGYLVLPRVAFPVANLVYLPLAIGGALWRPLEDEPRALDVTSQLLPTRNWIEVLTPLATGEGRMPLRHLGALAAWGVAFAALAWLGFRRDEGERFS
jgi:ABC-2 type transport system permease protein